MERILHESIGTLGEFELCEYQQGYDRSPGFSGFLDKTRHLFIYEERTRIHIDEVKNGESVFYGMEFEVDNFVILFFT